MQIGPFEAEFVRVTHSIPDAVAVALHTSEGTIVHTGDFKLDHTPIDGVRTDLARLAALGERGVALMLGDSTNAENPGTTRVRGHRRRRAATHRARGAGARDRHVLRVAHPPAAGGHRRRRAPADRRVCVVGRSMVKNLNIARNLGYADVPDGLLIKPQELDELPDDGVVILCTGSQGEPLSALTRIAYDDHQSVRVVPGDTVIMSAKPVPGNELAVHDTMNQLWRAGATVLHQDTAPVHVSGHGAAEELKTVLGLVRPDHVIPVHGEMRHLHAHARIARSLGVPADHVFIPELGDCFELEAGEVRRAGRVDAGVAFVDGLGIGAIQDVVLRDRRQLSADGTLVVVCQLHEDGNGAGSAEVIARGFAPEGAEEAETLLADVQTCAAETLAALGERETKIVQTHLHDAIAELVYRRARKRPLVIPIVVEV